MIHPIFGHKQVDYFHFMKNLLFFMIELNDCHRFFFPEHLLVVLHKFICVSNSPQDLNWHHKVTWATIWIYESVQPLAIGRCGCNLQLIIFQQVFKARFTINGKIHIFAILYCIKSPWWFALFSPCKQVDFFHFMKNPPRFFMVELDDCHRYIFLEYLLMVLHEFMCVNNSPLDLKWHHKVTWATI